MIERFALAVRRERMLPTYCVLNPESISSGLVGETSVLNGRHTRDFRWTDVRSVCTCSRSRQSSTSASSCFTHETERLSNNRQHCRTATTRHGLPNPCPLHLPTDLSPPRIQIAFPYESVAFTIDSVDSFAAEQLFSKCNVLQFVPDVLSRTTAYSIDLIEPSCRRFFNIALPFCLCSLEKAFPKDFLEFLDFYV